MARLKKPDLPLWAQSGHRRPITRRELLAAGSISFSASLLLPNIPGLLFSEAHAQVPSNCGPALGSGMIPVISLNLSGGAAMSSNFVPMDEGGQPLPSYDVMGLGDGQVPLELEFGSVPFAGAVDGVLISKFLQGLRATAPTALANTAFVGVCARSRDDSGENRFSIAGLVNAAGLKGSLLPDLGRRAGSFTGVNQLSAVLTPSAPLIVRDFNNIRGALGYAGALGSALNANQKASLAKTISRLSEAQNRKLASKAPQALVKNMIDCAHVKNAELASMTDTGIDLRTDAKGAELSAVWGVNANTGAGTESLVFGSMAYNTLKGNAGAAALELGGYDYHNNTRATGDAADLRAGQTVGRLLETAAIMGKPLFIHVTSDGAVNSPKSAERNAPWSSDRGIAGSSYILYYDPAGRKPTTANQLGFFTAGQVASEAFVGGNNPEVAAITVFANYLKLNHKMSVFESIVGRAFDMTKLDAVVRF